MLVFKLIILSTICLSQAWSTSSNVDGASCKVTTNWNRALDIAGAAQWSLQMFIPSICQLQMGKELADPFNPPYRLSVSLADGASTWNSTYVDVSAATSDQLTVYGFPSVDYSKPCSTLVAQNSSNGKILWTRPLCTPIDKTHPKQFIAPAGTLAYLPSAADASLDLLVHQDGTITAYPPNPNFYSAIYYSNGTKVWQGWMLGKQPVLSSGFPTVSSTTPLVLRPTLPSHWGFLYSENDLWAYAMTLSDDHSPKVIREIPGSKEFIVHSSARYPIIFRDRSVSWGFVAVDLVSGFNLWSRSLSQNDNFYLFDDIVISSNPRYQLCKLNQQQLVLFDRVGGLDLATLQLGDFASTNGFQVDTTLNEKAPYIYNSTHWAPLGVQVDEGHNVFSLKLGKIVEYSNLADPFNLKFLSLGDDIVFWDEVRVYSQKANQRD